MAEENKKSKRKSLSIWHFEPITIIYWHNRTKQKYVNRMPKYSKKKRKKKSIPKCETKMRNGMGIGKERKNKNNRWIFGKSRMRGGFDINYEYIYFTKFYNSICWTLHTRIYALLILHHPPYHIVAQYFPASVVRCHCAASTYAILFHSSLFGQTLVVGHRFRCPRRLSTRCSQCTTVLGGVEQMDKITIKNCPFASISSHTRI